MFPIRDHNPSEKTPYVTYALIAANVVIFLISLTYQTNEMAMRRFLFDWALIPAVFTDGQQLHGLFSSMFLHGGWMHLIGNMLFLWIFGDNLEEELGHLGFSLFYLASGVAAGLAQVASAPQSLVPMVGASGAIAGVMGGYLLMFPKARVDILFIFIVFFRVFPVPAWLMLGAWFALQLLAGAGADPDTGGVAYWAHAGGFVAGLVLIAPIWLRRGGRAYWDRTEGHPPHPESRYTQSSIPVVRRRK